MSILWAIVDWILSFRIDKSNTYQNSNKKNTINMWHTADGVFNYAFLNKYCFNYKFWHEDQFIFWTIFLFWVITLWINPFFNLIISNQYELVLPTSYLLGTKTILLGYKMYISRDQNKWSCILISWIERPCSSQILSRMTKAQFKLSRGMHACKY